MEKSINLRSLPRLLTDAAPASLKDVSAAVLTASIADDNAILFSLVFYLR
jgi:hypothetical protein